MPTLLPGSGAWLTATDAPGTIDLPCGNDADLVPEERHAKDVVGQSRPSESVFVLVGASRP
jgi:hypothetical protein